MRSNLILFFLFSFMLLAYSPSFAQRLGVPPPEEAPWSNTARGFVQVHAGFTMLPLFDLSSSHRGSDTQFRRTWDAKTHFPGIAAGLTVIPVFSNNGVILDAAYTLHGGEYYSQIENNGQSYDGRTTFGISLVDFHAGYARYFLEGPWHIYVGGKGGLQMVTSNMRVNYDGDDENPMSKKDKLYNWSAGGVFGVFRSLMTGGIGGELRVESTFFNSELTFQDPYGDIDFVFTHPLQIKLLVTFLLGKI